MGARPRCSSCLAGLERTDYGTHRERTAYGVTETLCTNLRPLVALRTMRAEERDEKLQRVRGDKR